MAAGGKRPGAGRPKGSKDKVGVAIKDMIENALHKKGGVKYFEWLADEHPQSFAALLKQIIPKDVKIEGDVSVGITSITREIVKKGKAK